MFRKFSSLIIASAAFAGTLAAQTAGKPVDFASGSEKASGYLAVPEGPGRKPAVVVIQEWIS